MSYGSKAVRKAGSQAAGMSTVIGRSCCGSIVDRGAVFSSLLIRHGSRHFGSLHLCVYMHVYATAASMRPWLCPNMQ